MTEVQRIIDQLERAMNGPAWHGPSLCEILSGVSPSSANTVSLKGAHTIWEILLHVIAWIRIGRLRIDSAQPAVDPDEKEDWPQVEDTGEVAWAHVMSRLREEHKSLLKSISRVSDSDLSRIVVGKEYNVYFLLHGIAQHNLYHAGQIALIKSLLIKR